MIETSVVTSIPQALIESRALEAQDHTAIKTSIESLIELSLGKRVDAPSLAAAAGTEDALTTVLKAVNSIPAGVIAGMHESPQILSGVR